MVEGIRSLFFLIRGFGAYMSAFGACSVLFDVTLIHFVVTLFQLKHILGLVDQRAHAS